MRQPAQKLQPKKSPALVKDWTGAATRPDEQQTNWAKPQQTFSMPTKTRFQPKAEKKPTPESDSDYIKKLMSMSKIQRIRDNLSNGEASQRSRSGSRNDHQDMQEQSMHDYSSSNINNIQLVKEQEDVEREQEKPVEETQRPEENEVKNEDAEQKEIASNAQERKERFMKLTEIKTQKDERDNIEAQGTTPNPDALESSEPMSPPNVRRAEPYKALNDDNKQPHADEMKTPTMQSISPEKSGPNFRKEDAEEADKPRQFEDYPLANTTNNSQYAYNPMIAMDIEDKLTQSHADENSPAKQ